MSIADLKIFDPRRKPSWILLVEDDSIIAEGLGEGLKRHGFRPVYASTVGEAMAKLSNQRFHAILLDIRLVRGSGEQVIHLLRSSHGPNQKAPIMVMSAFVDADLISRVRASVNGVLVKPFNLLTLVNRLGAMIAAHKKNAPEVQELLASIAPYAPVASPPPLEEFWANSPSVNQLNTALSSREHESPENPMPGEAAEEPGKAEDVESEDSQAGAAEDEDNDELRERLFANMDEALAIGKQEE